MPPVPSSKPGINPWAVIVVLLLLGANAGYFGSAAVDLSRALAPAASAVVGVPLPIPAPPPVLDGDADPEAAPVEGPVSAPLDREPAADERVLAAVPGDGLTTKETVILAVSSGFGGLILLGGFALAFAAMRRRDVASALKFAGGSVAFVSSAVFGVLLRLL